MPESPKKTDPLIRAAAWAVAIGLVALAVLALASYFFKWEGFWRGAGQPFATVLAALAAVSAAAIALHNGRSQLEELREQRSQDQERYVEQRDRDQTRYEDQRDRDQKRYEEQRDHEQARWADQRRKDDIKDLRTRFSEATAQLAHVAPAIRRSGAYAMASLIQDWRDLDLPEEAKVCIQVLGAYVTSPNLDATVDEQQHIDPGADGPIRALIVSLVCASRPVEFGDWRGACAVFDGGDLRGVELSGTFDPLVSFCATDLREASLISPKNLGGVDFSYATMDRSWIRNRSLHGTVFQWASLRGAHFDRSDVSGAVFKFAQLEGATFEDTKYNEDTQWPEGFTPPDDAILVSD